MKPNWKKIEIGLTKYDNIMSLVNSIDVSLDKDFQKKFNGFYKVQRRSPEFYKEYYSLLEQAKTRQITFSEILKQLHSKCKTVEASFSSKLLATVDPSFPVWDKEVLRNLGLKPPYSKSKDRVAEIISLYDKICDWHQANLRSVNGKSMVKEFDERFPENRITDLKKVDLILWQTRKRKTK